MNTEVNNATNDTNPIEQVFVEIKQEKVDIDETTISVGGLKEEPQEFVDVENQIDIHKNEVYDEQLHVKSKPSLVCENCYVEYDFVCLRCSSLIRILNKFTNVLKDRVKETLPSNLLQIIKSERSIDNEGVITLVTIPKNVIFGPFEGLCSTNSILGCTFTFENSKLANIGEQHTNWLKYVNNTLASDEGNLSTFQCGGLIFYKSMRQIEIGEELIVYYDEKCFVEVEEYGKKYFAPISENVIPLVYACVDCGLGFSTQKFLDQHLIGCPNKEIRLPPVCTPTQNTTYQLILSNPPIQNQQNNLVATIPYSKFRCFICDKYFKKRGILKKHILLVHDKDKHKYICDKCPFQTKYKQNYKDHVDGHDELTEHRCKICNKKLAGKYNLKIHLETHKPEASRKRYKCTQCEYSCKSPGVLKKHYFTHEDVKPYQCEVCEKHYLSGHQLKIHIKNKHTVNDVKDYKCTQCPYETNTKFLMKNHLFTHSDVRFECQHCGKKFARQYSLQLHISNMHTDNAAKKYKCDKCSYGTNRNSNFMDHVRKHDKNLHFQCDYCEKTVKFRYLLSLHVKNHHTRVNDKEFKCTECSYQTNYKQGIKKHRLMHERKDSMVKTIEKHEKV